MQWYKYQLNWLLFSKLWFCQKRALKNFSGQNNSQQQKYTTYENACDTSDRHTFLILFVAQKKHPESRDDGQ